MNNKKATTSKSSEYVIKIIGSTPNNSRRLGAEIAVPLKFSSNFWRSPDLPLLNCEIELHLCGRKIVQDLK